MTKKRSALDIEDAQEVKQVLMSVHEHVCIHVCVMCWCAMINMYNKLYGVHTYKYVVM